MKKLSLKKIAISLMAFVISITLSIGASIVSVFAIDAAKDQGDFPVEIEEPKEEESPSEEVSAQEVNEEVAEADTEIQEETEIEEVNEESANIPQKAEKEAEPQDQEAEKVDGEEEVSQQPQEEKETEKETAAEEKTEEPKAEDKKKESQETKDSEEDAKLAREAEEKKFEKIIAKAKLTGKKDKDFYSLVTGQIGRQNAWKIDFVQRLMNEAKVEDVKVNSSSIEKWIEAITAQEAKAIDEIKNNLEMASKGQENPPVKLVSYRPYDYNDVNLSDLVFFIANEEGKITYKVGVYAEKNFKKGSNGVRNHKTGVVTIITGDKDNNIVEKDYYVLKGLEENIDDMTVLAAPKDGDKKTAEDNSKNFFLAENEIIIEGIVSLEAEEVVIKAAAEVEEEAEKEVIKEANKVEE